MMRAWFKGALLLAITLAAGIGIGVMAERAHMHRGDDHTDAMRTLHSHFMHTLHESLGLDSAQHEAIVETLRRHQLHVDSAWGAMRPHVSATLDSTHAEIMKLLRPEQREAFLRLVGQAMSGTHR